jgi:GAF domain-containing protein
MRKQTSLPTSEIKMETTTGRGLDVEITSTLITYDGSQAILSIISDITEQKLADSMLNAVLESTVDATGQIFFDSATRSLCKLLDADCTIIGNIEKGNQVRSLAMQLDGKSIIDYTYNLQGSPCEKALETGYCEFSKNVCEQFPNDTDLVEMHAEAYAGIALKNKQGESIGIICVISRKKISLSPRVKKVFEIIASKAVTEIERMRAEKNLMNRMNEVERMNRLMVGRELKMEELRKEISRLKNEIATLRAK